MNKKFFSKYKVLAVAMCLVAATASSAFASDGMEERLFTFSNNNGGAVKEVNYYLANGAEVKFLDTAAKTTDSTVIVTVVLKIPSGIAPYKN